MKKIICISIFILMFIAAIDVFVLKGIFDLGFSNNEGEFFIKDNPRKPVPYFQFMRREKINASSYDKIDFWNVSENPQAIKVALFGGSTGEPLSEEYFSKKLSKNLKKEVKVVNFSCTSANHRQHLHMILELLSKSNPDIIIFYGGYNETGQHIFYDPRPGYPYNFFYWEEYIGIKRLLLEKSAIAGFLLRHDLYDSLSNLREEYKVSSPQWCNDIINKYFETVELSYNLSQSLKSKEYEHTKFFAFYQPWKVSTFPDWEPYHNKIRERIKSVDYIYDIHDAYDNLPNDIWEDFCHVKLHSGANEHIIDVMTKIISENINK